MKRAAFVVALATSWLVLLLWAAGVDWRAPPTPQFERSFPGSRFRGAFGRAEVVGQRLRVTAEGADHSALQVTQLPQLDARSFPILRYRFEDFPRTLELSLAFRTAENPDDVRTVSLPWPGSGTMTFDLSGDPAWTGTIIELGFAQFATGQLVPPEQGFTPFVLDRAELWSPSWCGDLAALATDWFGAWPWSQRSVHALGREGPTGGARSPVLVAALAVALAAACSLLLGGRRSRRALAVLLGGGLVAWLALDLRWEVGLVHRLLATRALYAGQDWPERARRVGDSAILAAADSVRELLRDEPAQRRILVYADSGYSLLRMVWHLQPLNVAPFWQAAEFGRSLPEDTLVVFYATDAWHANPAVRRLLEQGERIAPPGRLFVDDYEAADVVVYRFRHAR
ncbi:MAG: hypothetical protein EOP90_08045 [Lysobacteraceae bacterium]|nr:MAG: hypothetical protein EOP90_08045 [Xanthomonadaceae bacterium]